MQQYIVPECAPECSKREREREREREERERESADAADR